MNIDRIAQAVLIADDLLAQYNVLIEQMGDVDDGATMADQFSNLIGEANQVYAGVWEQLDEAAAAFVAAGRGLPSYAQLRAEHGHLGIVDSSSQTGLALGASLLSGGVATQTSVAATANSVGAGHAADISVLFKAKLPEFDWEAARRAADAPSEDLTSNNNILTIAVALGVAAIVAYLMLR